LTNAPNAPNASLATPLDRWWRLAAWGFCAVGAAARIAAYLQHRSLWYDEAAVALSIVRRGFLSLLQPLDNLQSAPPLFLWAERLVVLASEANEWSLRAVPLMAGIATAPLMWRVARRVLPTSAAVIAVALVALSPTLVRYSAEAKPYAVDALVTLLLADRTLALETSGWAARRWWQLAVIGAVALVASTPAVFVLAGVVAYVGWRALAQRDVRRGARVAGLAAAWGGTFVLLVATVFRPLVGSESPVGRFMQWYWATNFLTPEPPGLAVKVSVMVWAVLTNTFLGGSAPGGSTTALLVVALVGGAMLVATKRIATLLLIIVPAAAVTAASALRRYPIAERLVLFAAPLTALLLASAQLLVARLRPARWRETATIAATIVVAFLATRGTWYQLESDDGRQESRSLVRAAVRRHAAGMPVWVSGGGEVAWRFYSGQTDPVQRPPDSDVTSAPGGTLPTGVLVGAWYNSLPERILPVVDDTAAASRPSAWSEAEATRLREVARPCALVFLSHIQPGEQTALLASVAARGGRPVASTRAPGAELHEVCFSTGSPTQR
jgi:hypothetical protein